jgi:arylsulfatase A-like enzyme
MATTSPHPDERTAPASRWFCAPPMAAGFVCGAALGLFEASILVGAHAQYVQSFSESMAVLLLPPLAYGFALLLFGALPLYATNAGRNVWPLLFLLGALLLLRWRRSDLGGSAPLAASVIGAFGLAIVFALRHPRPRVARVLRALGVVLPLLFPFASIGALALARDPQPAFAKTQRAATADSPNVVLVTWDTVRADFLPLWGGGGLDTPNLDRLAREGVVFENVTAVAPITGPAHLSLLTGLYPIRHGLRSNGERAPDLPIPRLPELLQQAGYATGAFVSNLALMRRNGFDRGMDAFDDRPAAPPLARFVSLARLGSIVLERFLPASLSAAAFQTPGEVTLARVRAWYAHAPGPTFLWAHFYDAHAPYEPTEPYVTRTRARASEGPHAVDPRSEEDVVGQRAEIEKLDELLGELRAELEAADPGLEHTLLAVVADHGECFGEGGICRGHHRSLEAATQHVPLVIRFPREREKLAGVRVTEPACQIDFLPTICAEVGITPPPECGGIDLKPVALGDDAPARGFYLEAFQRDLGDQRLQGWSQAGWKYVRTLGGEERLYGPTADGHEQRVDDPARMATLRKELEKFLAAQPQQEAGAKELDDKEREGLKALGYAGD